MHNKALQELEQDPLCANVHVLLRASDFDEEAKT